MRYAVLALLLCACTLQPPREATVEWIAHGTSEPVVMRDGDRCVLVTGREVSYGQLGAMIKECFQEK